MIQPDGLYLREFDGDAVEELGKTEVDIPQGTWHTVTIEFGGEDGNHVVVKQLLNGEIASQTSSGDTYRSVRCVDQEWSTPFVGLLIR